MWLDLPKRSYTCTVSRRNFCHHLIATWMDQQHMCLILLKIKQSAFTQASFSSLYDVHRCSGGIQMALSFLDKQTADWLTTWMADEFGLAFSCFMWYMEVKMAPMEVIWLFLVWRCSLYAPLVAPCPPLTVPAYRSAGGIGYTSK